MGLGLKGKTARMFGACGGSGSAIAKRLARDVGRDGVTANIVLPGRIATDRIALQDEQKPKRENRTVEAVSAESTATIPIGRHGDPQEYANVVNMPMSSPFSPACRPPT